MSHWDWGNPPINSTSNPPIAAGSTTALYAELDSTMLGTKNLVPKQQLRVEVNWILGGDTNITWQCETAASTDLAISGDVMYVKTPTAQSAQYRTRHILEKDYRIRVRQFSTGSSGTAYIWAEVMT